MRAVVLALLLACSAATACRRDRAVDPNELAPLPAITVDPDQLRRELAAPGDLEALTDRSLGAYERATLALEWAGEDCRAATLVLRAIAIDDGDAIARAKLVSELPDLRERVRPLLQARAERTRALGKRFDAALGNCAGYPAMARLLERFF